MNNNDLDNSEKKTRYSFEFEQMLDIGEILNEMEFVKEPLKILVMRLIKDNVERQTDGRIM